MKAKHYALILLLSALSPLVLLVTPASFGPWMIAAAFLSVAAVDSVILCGIFLLFSRIGSDDC